MADYIDINGARIEREFFNDNLKEAGQYVWRTATELHDNHKHCLICQAAIANGEVHLGSDGGVCCEFCAHAFLKHTVGK